MALKGGCSCGSVRYKITDEPNLGVPAIVEIAKEALVACL